MSNWPIYGTLAEHDAYHAAHGNPAAWNAATDAEKVEAGREASEYLDHSYVWKGRKATSDQVRDWPRTYARDDDGYTITGVPRVLKDAASYLMLRVIEGETLMPDIAAGELEGAIKRRHSRIEGLEEEVEYEGGAIQSTAKRFPKITAMLRHRGLIERRGRIERG